MTNIWETQEMEETARSRQWEDLNANTYDLATLESIKTNIEDAYSEACNAMQQLEEARKQVAWLTLEDDIKECMNIVETVQDDILRLLNLVGKEMSA